MDSNNARLKKMKMMLEQVKGGDNTEEMFQSLKSARSLYAL